MKSGAGLTWRTRGNLHADIGINSSTQRSII
jgi:hypothetical protein